MLIAFLIISPTFPFHSPIFHQNKYRRGEIKLVWHKWEEERNQGVVMIAQKSDPKRFFELGKWSEMKSITKAIMISFSISLSLPQQQQQASRCYMLQHWKSSEKAKGILPDRKLKPESVWLLLKIPMLDS